MTASSVIKDLISDPSGALGLGDYAAATIADFVEEALLSTSRTRSGEIQDALVDIYYEALRRSSEPVAAVAHGENEKATELHEAFILGQISLAQLITSQHYDHKACDVLLGVMQDDANAVFIKALYLSACNNKGLAARVNQTEENVSRRLKRLREYGITSSRKLGTSVENFLTAAARSLIEDQDIYGLKSPARARMQAEARSALQSKRQALPEEMQQFSSFGRQALRSCA